MPSWSKRSREKLETCDPLLQVLFNKVIKEFDCTVLCGRRGKDEQDEKQRQGLSKVGWPDSNHNCPAPDDPQKEDPDGKSKAVDVAPYPINWEDRERFCFFAGYVKGVAQEMGIPIRWGGDWDGDTILSDNRFDDLPHYELV